MKTKKKTESSVSDKVRFKNVIIKPVHTDDRGDIYDILEGADVDHIGMVTFSKKGIVRGNHYHLKSVQYSYVLEGRLLLTISDPNGKRKKEYTLEPGTFTAIPPLKVHSYKSLSKARMLDMSTLDRNASGYEDDTVRVEL